MPKPSGEQANPLEDIERTRKLAEQIHFDMETAKAVRTQSVELVAGVVADFLVSRLELLLLEPLSDNQLLGQIHEIRGTLRALGEIGDSVRNAHQFMIKRTVRERMGMGPQARKEDER